MRTRFIKFDPGTVWVDVHTRRVSHDAAGLYFMVLLECYLPFGEGGTCRRRKLKLDDGALLRQLGDVRKVRRLLTELRDEGLLLEQADGDLVPLHYDPGSWIRRAANAIEYNMVAVRDGERCRKCDATDSLEVDHVVAIVAEGSDSIENLQLLCRTCNARKGGRRG